MQGCWSGGWVVVCASTGRKTDKRPLGPVCMLGHAVTISSPIVQIYSQVADLGSACKLAPQSLGLPQTERLSMRVLKSILKLREVSPLAWELYTVSRKGQVTKHK